MLRYLGRVIIAVLLALPGTGLACLAKPLLLGEATLFLGLLVAFGVPIWWLVNERQLETSGLLGSEKRVHSS